MADMIEANLQWESIVEASADLKVKEFNVLPKSFKEILKKPRQKCLTRRRVAKFRRNLPKKTKVLAKSGARAYKHSRVDSDYQTIILNCVEEGSQNILNSLGSEAVREFGKLLTKNKARKVGQLKPVTVRSH